MAGLDDVGTVIPVREVMSSPVVTVLEKDNAELVAKLMSAHKLGSVIVTDNKGNPVGIITERDMVKRVVAKNLFPSEIKAGKIMSKPLVTVDPQTSIGEAARKMNTLIIRRLAVMDRGKLVGIVSSKDILAVTPELTEIITEKVMIAQNPPVEEGPLLAGYCDNCRQWSDSLKEVEGSFLCDDCQAELEAEVS